MSEADPNAVAPPVKPATPAATTVTRAEKTVPLDSFKAEKVARQAAEVRAAAAEEKATAAEERAATADTIAKSYEELKASVKVKEAAWGEERALLGAGITDPEDADVARLLYARLPAEGKPKTIADAVTAWRADPTKAPKALAHVFGPATSPAGADGKSAAPPTPKPTGTPGTRPTAGEPVTGAALKVLRESAQASGDWTAFNEASKAAEVERRAARGAR